MSPTCHTALTVVSAEAPRAAAEALLELLSDQGHALAAWEDAESGVCRVDIFLPGQSDSTPACHALAAAGRALGLDLRPAVASLPAQDWAESWKRFFPVERVSDRIVIRPSWESYVPRPRECVVDLDPGLSFGTGRHGTTRACLVFLDRLAASGTRRGVLDMGCGSGILAIAAAKLGFEPVAGFDNDPDAVAIARGNAALNGVRVTWQVCDLAACNLTADVVVANILAGVLGANADGIAAAVRPGPQAALILSGILDTQYAAVRAAYISRGFTEDDSLLLGEWRTGLFHRRDPSVAMPFVSRRAGACAAPSRGTPTSGGPTDQGETS